MLRTIAVYLAISLLATGASADDWGSFKGRFIFDGTPPTQQPLNAKMALGFCGDPKLVSEELVVNPKTRGVKNVLVYLYLGPNDPKPALHPILKNRPKDVRIDNDRCRFQPHILIMTVDQKLIIGNLDIAAHAAKLDPLNPLNVSIAPLIPAMKTHEYRFNVEERLPSSLTCGIHPWMKGYIFARDTPYFAITDDDGNFEIENLPVGEWKFRCWQEKVGYVQQVTVDGKATKWKRGEVTVKIEKDKASELNIASKF